MAAGVYHAQLEYWFKRFGPKRFLLTSTDAYEEDTQRVVKDVSHFLLSDSIIRTLRHHLGTMALGSFITAVVITIKYVAVYVITQIQAQSPENKMCVGSAAGRPIAKA